MATASPPSPRTRSKPKKESSFLGSLARFAILAWILRCLVVEPFYIPSGSMQPNMAIGDYLFVEKWPYGYSRMSFLWQFPPISGRIFPHLPARGDVVVFKPPGRENETWVKRVIGLPGDTIAVDNGTVILNGQPISKTPIGDTAIPVTPNSPCRSIGHAPRLGRTPTGAETCLYPAFRETLPGGRSFTTLDQADVPADHFDAVTVPAGTVFMMGDNRDDSEDSRFSPDIGGAGFVPLDHLVGRAGFAFWSTDGSASYVQPWTWFTALRAHRLGTAY